MYVLVGDEVYGLIEPRHWNLVDRRELRKSPNFESADHNIDQSTRPLDRDTIQLNHINHGPAGVTKYFRLDRVYLIIFPTIAIRHHDL